MPDEKSSSTTEPVSFNTAASSLLENVRRALSGARGELEATITEHAKQTKLTLRRIKAQQTKLAAEPKPSAKGKKARAEPKPSAKGKKARMAAAKKELQELGSTLFALPEDPAAIVKLAQARAQEAEAIKKAYQQAFKQLEKDLETLGWISKQSPP